MNNLQIPTKQNEKQKTNKTRKTVYRDPCLQLNICMYIYIVWIHICVCVYIYIYTHMQRERERERERESELLPRSLCSSSMCSRKCRIPWVRCLGAAVPSVGTSAAGETWRFSATAGAESILSLAKGGGSLQGGQGSRLKQPRK